MNKMIAAAIGLSVAGPAMAQSGVTLYGVLNTGISYISNQGGSSNVRMDSGTLMMSRFGLKGSEDLGGGTKAIFELEQGFSGTTGAVAGCLSSSCAFSRNAYVGLDSQRYGAATAGLQTTTYADILGSYMGADLLESTYWSVHPGDYDQVFRAGLGNSIKYQSSSFAGLKLSGTYNFGGVPGSIVASSQWSVGLNYTAGALSAGASYLRNHGAFEPTGIFLSSTSNPIGPKGTAGESESFGAGLGYQFSTSTLHLLATQTDFTTAGAIARTYEIGYSNKISSSLTLNLDYQYTDVLHRAGIHLPVAMLDYFLSKRTDLYGVVAYEQARGKSYTGAPIAASIFTVGDSSTGRQLAVGVGIRHFF
ncbi:porin [Trinickia dinghuensis]|uniref:Porin n=2 Tax=Trinickia dinghuensis TaxID=2291023 RepID=A0A3D8K6Y5_9BURK|nr:porin [Trinickia dinghuensis]